MTITREKISEILKKNNINLVYREENINLWNEVFNSLESKPVRYLNSSIDYYIKYSHDQGSDCMDLSCIIFSDINPIAIWPLSMNKELSSLMLSSHGSPILEPLFINCPKKTSKNTTRNCINAASDIANELNMKSWLSFSNVVNNFSLSNWHLISMSLGASISSMHELYVDLNMPIDEIKSNFRKSYRPLVNLGEKLWDITLINTDSSSKKIEEHINEFRQLHQEVSGKKTRSTESWNFQRDCIANNEAFLVCLRDETDKLIGAGYFSFTSDEGVYAIAAYDRNLFEKPLGHIVQFKAIKELQNMGCNWYYIGRRSFENDFPKPSDKEISISKFKEGFSTNVFPSFTLEVPANL
tara:strand:- start:15 stop:1076 length:1062 start_codon:yes stop_codon:yes gene_type:complete